MRVVRRPPTMRALIAPWLLALGVGCQVVRDVPPSAAEITVDLRPTLVSAREFRHGMDLTVRATNHGTRPVTVRLATPPGAARYGAPPSVGFGLRIMRADGSHFGSRYLATDDSADVLLGGQTRRRGFHIDFGGATPVALPPGDYDLIGSYGDTEAAPVRLRVSP